MPGSSKWSLSLRFPHPNPVYASPLPHICYMPCPPQSQFITWTILGKEYRSLSSSLCSFLRSRYPVSLRPKYSQYPQPTVLPQCKWPSFTPTHNNKQYYSSVYLSLWTFGQQTGRQKILHRMTSIPWLQSAPNFFLYRLLIS
jgi:hypothetical protein